MGFARAGAAVITAVMVGCGGQAGNTPLAEPAHFLQHRLSSRSTPISHVVIIIQENRSVDDLFNGFPGADTVKSGRNSHGRTIGLKPDPLTGPYDVSHAHSAFLTEYANGKLNGFDRVTSHCNVQSQCPPQKVRAYVYVPESEVKPYWSMAKQYAFADQMFQTNEGPSFPAHQYLVSGTSTIKTGSTLRASEEPRRPSGTVTGGCSSPKGSLVQVIDPSGSENQTVFPCFHRLSLMQEADAASVSWRYYQAHGHSGAWNAPDALRPIWKSVAYHDDVSYPPSNIFTDIANRDLASIVWVTPTAAASDHAGTTDGSGPSWVASVVNAIGQSRYWDSTAIFVVWDDWGGWYDHVAPKIRNSYELGFRVPLVVISAYTKRHYVSHVQHEFGSILKFTEERLGLPSLGTTDVAADDLSDCFDFNAPPRRFKRIHAKYSARYFLDRPPSDKDPDADDDL
jgi:phospholipase C